MELDKLKTSEKFRYYFNRETGQFVQLSEQCVAQGTTQLLFNEWIEITKDAFDVLLGMRSVLLDLRRYLRSGPVICKSDREFCLDKIDSALYGYGDKNELR